jgi:hypothetical protein
MFIAAVGHSEDPDAHRAAEEIREQCEKRLAGHRPKAGMLFAAIDFDHEELIAAVNKFWHGLELIGCTTDGEVSSDLGFLEDSAVLILFASDAIDITAGVGRRAGEDTSTACRDAVKMARSKTALQPAICVTTPESLTCSGQQIVDSLVSELGMGVPLVGGTAGDQFRINKTYQFFGNEVLADSVPLLLFSGPLDYSFSVGIGCKQVGTKGTVTKSEGTILHEIDSAPAAEFYRKMMGSATMSATETPLAVLDENGEIDYMRTAAGDFNPQTGALTMFADTQEGSRVQLATTDRDSLVDSCGQAARVAGGRFPAGKRPDAALVFSCAGRKVLLGTRTAEEQQALADVVDPSVPCAGFYTYGEISPSVSLEAGARFHNHTIVTVLLGERDE